jgi:hypothetical protein
LFEGVDEAGVDVAARNRRRPIMDMILSVKMVLHMFLVNLPLIIPQPDKLSDPRQFFIQYTSPFMLKNPPPPSFILLEK